MCFLKVLLKYISCAQTHIYDKNDICYFTRCTFPYTTFKKKFLQNLFMRERTKKGATKGVIPLTKHIFFCFVKILIILFYFNFINKKSY